MTNYNVDRWLLVGAVTGLGMVGATFRDAFGLTDIAMCQTVSGIIGMAQGAVLCLLWKAGGQK